MEHIHEHAGTAEVYSCPMHPEVRSDKPGNCPKCGMALVNDGVSNEAVHKHDRHQNDHQQHSQHKSNLKHEHLSGGKYTCPMHPHILRDEPGKCPLCGMKLEPVATGTT